MTNIKHIVFDVGQVLILWDREIPFRHLIPDPKKRQWFLDEVCTPEWNMEQDRGRSWGDAEALLIKEFPDEENAIRGFRKHWIEMIPHALDGTVAIYNALIDAGVDVTLLTNFHQDTFPLAKDKYPFLKMARSETVSGEIGLIKPDRTIFDHHIEAHNIDPAATLFFDDSPKNVEGAKAAGWQAELFTGAEKMRGDLARFGVEYGG
jgi:2-haloacid dehalogenase